MNAFVYCTPGSTYVSIKHLDKRKESGPNSFSKKWTKTVESFHKPILRVLHSVADVSAKNPRRTVWAVFFFTILIGAVGIMTNFESDAEDESVWTPNDSAAVSHSAWIDEHSGFPEEPRTFAMFFHTDGNNVLSADNIRRVFTALDAVQDLANYTTVCNEAPSGDCKISGIVDFWNQSAAVFDSAIGSDDNAAIEALSAGYYPDGTPVSENSIFGKPQRDATGELVFVQSFSVLIDFPETADAEEFEVDAVNAVLKLDEEWEAEAGTSFRVEVVAAGSFGEEFTRAIVKDVPLVPIVFVVMALFTCAVFFKRDGVQSRSLLGYAAVRTVTFSLISGYGLMFVLGVPFTSMTQILPFVIYGVGLDDSFIIMGSYGRTDPKKDAVERIHEAIDDIGISISLTSMTSMLAFGLGATSTIPTVYWVCYYAMAALAFVFLYQITYFVAHIALDERRIQENRRDCFRCCQKAENLVEESPKEGVTDRFMTWYAEKLLRPRNKQIIFAGFVVFTVYAARSAAKLEQAFDLVDVLPSNSFVADFYNSLEEYTLRNGISPGVYFRDVDQSDPDIQAQMEAYVQEMVEIKSILFYPDHFWIRDFKQFVNETAEIQDFAFVDQLDLFLEEPVYYQLYADHIVRDSDGSILASRCIVPMDNLDLEEVKEQIDALEDTQTVANSQAINKGHRGADYPFFAYDGIFHIWEFYAASVDELIFTAVAGVCAVTVVALVFIPHWTAAFFVLPTMCVLYIDLLGFLQWVGVAINPISYIAIVMSIGLLVDFVMHTLLRYYESTGNRRQKTEELLRTMGSSILIGAVSTLLGTMILVFSSSQIFATIFYAFVGLVVLGASHGLILLPVILSTIGPEDEVDSSDEERAAEEKARDREELGMTEVSVCIEN